MRVFKLRRFAKDAKAQGLTDELLLRAVKEFEEGLTGNELGGNLFKKRIAIGSRGKSAGLRTIIAFKTNDEKLFCLYVFAKNQADNISKAELEALKKLAAVYLKLTDEEIIEAISSKALEEVMTDEDEAEINE